MVPASNLSSQVATLQRDVERLQRELAAVSKRQADKSRRIAQIQSSITKYTSAASRESKAREVQRLTDQLADLQAKTADLNRRVADKTARLHQVEQRLISHQAKEQQRLIDTLKRAERDRIMSQSTAFRNLRQDIPRPSVGSPTVNHQKVYDAFISHASEDKADFVRPLATALVGRGIVIWYDEFELEIGDSLRQSIDKGLANSRFGIVVLSPAFFAKNWPQYELDGLVEKEMQGGKVVLPIWHRVSKNEVMQYSPTLAGKFALSTSSYTIEELAEKLAEAVRAA
jgi:hypothetical protein